MSDSLRGSSIRQDPLYGRTAHTKCCTYLLAVSLAAALLDGLFDHPAEVSPVVYTGESSKFLYAKIFPQPAER